MNPWERLSELALSDIDSHSQLEMELIRFDGYTLFATERKRRNAKESGKETNHDRASTRVRKETNGCVRVRNDGKD